MNFFKQVKSKIQESGKLAQNLLAEYISLNANSKQLILRQKTVSLLCQQAESKIEQLISLTPHPEEGLIATVEQKGVKVQLHFTPDKITLYEDHIEGRIRLLTPPQFQTDSLVYRYLIAGWQIFLGGRVPNNVLPEGVKLEGDKLYYTLPREQLKLVDALFDGLKNESALNLSIKQGELIIDSAVALSLDKINFRELWQILNLKSVFPSKKG